MLSIEKTNREVKMSKNTVIKLNNISTLGADIVPDNPQKPLIEQIKDFRKKPDRQHLWFDTSVLKSESSDETVFTRIFNHSYNGVIFYLDNIDLLLSRIPKSFRIIVNVDTKNDIDQLLAKEVVVKEGRISERLIISSSIADVLEYANRKKIPACLRMYIRNAKDLHESIEVGSKFEYLMVGFADATNIPLELVIASLQNTDTQLIKEIKSCHDIDDAIVVSGVMEVGVEGISFSPIKHHVLDLFLERQKQIDKKINIEVCVVVESKPIGIGYRACIDLATIFTPDEGMLIGSTSHGGILCCPEVFHLPYMELRPFRVNAGGIHSYVYNIDNKTDYMSELKSGDSVMIAGIDGKLRKAPIGRMKIEVRPLRLIGVKFKNGNTVNVIMQDDWHVRIFSHEGKPENITELKIGDKVLGYATEPGRHVGIKINENILEK